MKVYIQLKECSTGDQYVNHWSYRLYTFGGNGYDLHFKKRYKKKTQKKKKLSKQILINMIFIYLSS